MARATRKAGETPTPAADGELIARPNRVVWVDDDATEDAIPDRANFDGTGLVDPETGVRDGTGDLVDPETGVRYRYTASRYLECDALDLEKSGGVGRLSAIVVRALAATLREMGIRSVDEAGRHVP